MIAIIWTALFAVMIYIASIDVGIFSHLVLSVAILSILLLAKPLIKFNSLRLLIIGASTFLTMRYLTWRITNTIPDNTWYETTFGILLLFAELYGIWIFLAGIFIGVRPINRKVIPLPTDESKLPTVDILIPTYNENWSVLGPTLISALQITYPKEKVNIYCCDDGGTLEKRNKSEEAKKRHEFLKAKCQELGIHYITREKNTEAKAGNLNHAMKSCTGEIVVIFDADHAPTTDFLENTVAQFLKDDKLFLVQTPHFFISPDPLEKNLGVHGVMPAENDMFYRHMHPGLDFWNSSFFCGSAALLRRKYLDEVGGIQTRTITEDADTALELHSRGYNSAYINIPMVAGLQPVTFTTFVGQRIRWAQGMVQIFLLNNPLFKKGLNLSQRLCYTANSGFWFFSFARLIFLFSPVLFLLFGLELFKTNGYDFLAYSIPHLISAILLNNHLYGKYRWPFISEIYEIALSIHTLPAILKVFISPRKPHFKVTSKDEKLNESFLSPLSSPFIFIFMLLLMSVGVGIWKYIEFPQYQESIAIVSGWAIFNILLMLGVLGALWESKEIRNTPRVPRSDLYGKLTIGQTEVRTQISDISTNGALLTVLEGTGTINQSTVGELTIPVVGREKQSISVNIKSHRFENGRKVIGVNFVPKTKEEEAEIIHLMYGYSSIWQKMSQDRTVNHSFITGFYYFLKLVIKNGFRTIFHSMARR